MSHETIYRQVLEAAKRLGKGDRLRLRDQLNEDIDDPAETDAAFHRELERRRIESERDPSIMIPWDEVRAQLRAKYL